MNTWQIGTLLTPHTKLSVNMWQTLLDIILSNTFAFWKIHHHYHHRYRRPSYSCSNHCPVSPSSYLPPFSLFCSLFCLSNLLPAQSRSFPDGWRGVLCLCAFIIYRPHTCFPFTKHTYCLVPCKQKPVVLSFSITITVQHNNCRQQMVRVKKRPDNLSFLQSINVYWSLICSRVVQPPTCCCQWEQMRDLWS